ncbi:hypothetical protein GOARA_091_00260 [Gordonia araii NBRC 100433]|uniref:ESX secretion-associated protein EspG n=1 Tax=Gordonia araii NBRC 100433 TaxID=1073574 RepID=G7H7T3_9ACTN|nr:ESX secretion-associated protein EspG [Gordonia araii]GAB11908.1 hypothetical protein GOARA_091_00260 [Gordonia araii NBRC 100433]
MWDTAAPTVLEFSLDELDALTDAFDVQSWPVILGLRVRQATVDERRAAVEAGADALRGRGLLDDGEFADEVILAVRTLCHEDAQISVRFTDGPDAPLRRVALCRSGTRHVLAMRRGDRLLIQSVDVQTADDAATRIADLLGDEDPVGVTGVSVPTDELVSRLNDCTSANDYAQALHAVGATESDATSAALALAECSRHVEIVAYETVAGSTAQSSGAMAVYSTPRGRMVASPSKSPDGRLWTTISPGSGHRIRQAVVSLIETLPSTRWMP